MEINGDGARAENQTRTNPYFEVLASGNFSPEKVSVAVEPYPKLSDELQKEVDDEWDKRNKDRVEKGEKTFKNDPQFILHENPNIQNDTLDMRLYIGGFKLFIAAQNKEIADKLPVKPGSLGTNIVLETADNHLMIIQRDINAPTKPGAMSVAGGYADFDKDLEENGERWNPFKTVKRELKEEAGVEEGDLNDVSSLGILYNKTVNNPTFAFLGRSNLTSDEIRSKNGTQEVDSDDNVKLRFIPNTQGEIEKMILWHAFSPSPSGAGTLALYGKGKFGDEWFDRIQERLSYRERRLYGKLKDLPEDQVKSFESRATERLLRQK